jgi:hypothetical protein
MPPSASPRWPLAVLGASVGALTLSMALFGMPSAMRGGPAWVGPVWAAGIMAGTFTAIILLMIGTGLLSDASLARRGSPEGRAPTVGVFIGVYVGWIVVSLAAAFYLQHLYGLDARRGVLVVSGGIMVLASSGHPWWLYETLRRVRWFGSIRSDGTLRPIMLAIGILAIWVGLYVPAIAS